MYHMSKTLHRRAAANAFAEGRNQIRTSSALTFEGDVAFSYAEPIAVRVGEILYVTDAKFSVTTSGHTSAVAGAWAVAAAPKTGHDGDYNVRRVGHGEIRRMARERGFNLAYATHGRRYDREAVPA